MNLNFSSKAYFDKALSLAAGCPRDGHSGMDAFFLLLRDAKPEQLENLLRQLEAPGGDREHLYLLTQGKGDFHKPGAPAPMEILCAAYNCLNRGLPLGTETTGGGTINTSHWMGHSLLEGKLCAVLAKALGLDGDFAYRLGVLHDYGRKEVHTLAHTVRGFELLVDQGWEAEALGCLTHSFLGGGRCASNEAAEPGFYVDDQGRPRWTAEAAQDEVTGFLSHYTYTDYDIILNLADLMATSQGIVSPMERIADIATRRTIDPTNRGYFLAELTNQLRRMERRITGQKCAAPEIKAAKGVSLAEIQEAFARASESFFEVYQELEKRN